MSVKRADMGCYHDRMISKSRVESLINFNSKDRILVVLEKHRKIIFYTPQRSAKMAQVISVAVFLSLQRVSHEKQKSTQKK